MRIWITELGEPLPLEENVRLHRYGEFSKYLASQGHDVTWWSSSFSHAPKKHLVEQDAEVDHSGVRLKLIKGPGYKKNVSLGRIKHQQHFANRFLELAETEPLPDLILAPIPTIEVATAVSEFAEKKNVPYLVDVRDLWPDEFKFLAPKPLQPIARMFLHPLYKKMRKLCQKATGIMGVSQSYRDYGVNFAGRSPQSTDHIFPLGYKKQQISDEAKSQAESFWRQQGLKDGQFVISFIGTIGHFFALDTVIQAARQLKEHTDIVFLLAGSGSHLEKYKKMAADLDNVIFPGWIQAPQISTLLSRSSIGLAPYKEGSQMSLPNKPFEYMSAHLPIISSIQGELKDLLAEYEAGVTYNANNADELAKSVLLLYKHREKAKFMGEKAYELYSKKFDTSVVFKNTLEHIIKVVNEGHK